MYYILCVVISHWQLVISIENELKFVLILILHCRNKYSWKLRHLRVELMTKYARTDTDRKNVQNRLLSRDSYFRNHDNNIYTNHLPSPLERSQSIKCAYFSRYMQYGRIPSYILLRVNINILSVVTYFCSTSLSIFLPPRKMIKIVSVFAASVQRE